MFIILVSGQPELFRPEFFSEMSDYVICINAYCMQNTFRTVDEIDDKIDEWADMTAHLGRIRHLFTVVEI